jgi:hypothetical protein
MPPRIRDSHVWGRIQSKRPLEMPRGCRPVVIKHRRHLAQTSMGLAVAVVQFQRTASGLSGFGKIVDGWETRFSNQAEGTLRDACPGWRAGRINGNGALKTG